MCVPCLSLKLVFTNLDPNEKDDLAAPSVLFLIYTTNLVSLMSVIRRPCMCEAGGGFELLRARHRLQVHLLGLREEQNIL